MPPLPPQVEILTIPCLADNYAFVLHNQATDETVLIDAPEAAPIQAALDARGWTLTDILLTHHHDDHIQATAALRGTARVIGATADAHRLPPLDLGVAEGDQITLAGYTCDIIDVSGHTIGHIAGHMPDLGAVFTADSLMALGCGRLFEGPPDMMWQNLQKLRALPDDTTVYSGHEYTAANAKFALTIEPDNAELISRVAAITAARAAGHPTVPSSLALERATNPFLRADHPALHTATGLTGQTPAQVFAAIRKQKDNF